MIAAAFGRQESTKRSDLTMGIILSYSLYWWRGDSWTLAFQKVMYNTCIVDHLCYTTHQMCCTFFCTTKKRGHPSRCATESATASCRPSSHYLLTARTKNHLNQISQGRTRRKEITPSLTFGTRTARVSDIRKTTSYNTHKWKEKRGPMECGWVACNDPRNNMNAWSRVMDYALCALRNSYSM